MNDLAPTLQPSVQSGNGAVYQADCASRTQVVIAHRDTLGRPLPEGTAVRLVDSRGSHHPGLIDAEGYSHHTNVIAGPVAWELKDASGYHLVAIEDIPFHPVACGIAAPSAMATTPETTITATYLPPPIVVNLRDEQEESVADHLSNAQIEQLRLNGNNATLFVHGYSVPHGDWARFNREADLASMPAALQPVSLITPSGNASIATLCQSEASDADDRKLNGSGACNWLTNMEYQLNRAAGLPDDDWRQYTRIVGVFWPGDTGMTEFVESEFNAMRSGRRLVNVLVQLIEAGITINMISHSLGARVVLTALNILGARGLRQRIDHLFLWEPAVADNALSPDTPFTETPPRDDFGSRDTTNSPAREVHPLGMGTFPTAHLAAKNIVVLHSHEDGILGPSAKEATNEHEINAGKQSSSSFSFDNLLGSLGGAYTKKWWTFPPHAGDGLRYFQDYYFERSNALRGGWASAFQAYTLQKAHYGDSYAQRQIGLAWDKLEQAIVDEARRVWAMTPAGPLRADTPLPDYDLLKPLSHHYRISESMARLFAQKLRQLGQRDGWQPRDTGVRPALGLIGFTELETDPFFEPRILAETFYRVDQSKWFFSHSAMKYPTEEIFIKSYMEGITNRIKEKSRFGRF